MADPAPVPAQAAPATASYIQVDAASVNDLASFDMRVILNAALSRGCAPIVELLLHVLPPDLSVLSLDGSNLLHDIDGILQCFSLLRDSHRAACSDLSTFEACNYSNSSFNFSSALVILNNFPVDRSRIQTLKLRQFQVNDDLLIFCCTQFSSLHVSMSRITACCTTCLPKYRC